MGKGGVSCCLMMGDAEVGLKGWVKA